MEHFRTSSAGGNVYQWCDTDLAMVVDTVTGEHERFGKHGDSIGTVKEAKEYVEKKKGWESRTVIVLLSTIAAHKM